MKPIFIVLIVIGIIVVILFLIKLFTKNKDSGSSSGEDIFNRGSRVAGKFKDCCIKKIKRLFGGGA